MITDKTARQVDRYFKRLVKKQPMWLKMLFESDRIAFIMDPSGALQLEVDTALDEEVRQKIAIFIARYFHKHPAPFLTVNQIQ